MRKLGKRTFASFHLSNGWLGSLDLRERLWRFLGVRHCGARPPAVKLTLEILEALVLPNNLLATSVTSDVTPADTVLIAPATDVTFVASADSSTAPSTLATVLPTADPTSGVQQTSQLSGSTATAAPTTTPMPADLVFQSGFNDLYASPLNDAQFASLLQTAPAQSATAPPSATPTAQSAGAGGTVAPTSTSVNTGSSVPADGSTAYPTPTDIPPSDSGGGYDPSTPPVYVTTNYSNTQTGGGTTTTYGMDGSGGSTTAASADSWTMTMSGSMYSDGSWTMNETYNDAYDVSLTSTTVGGLTQHDWGTSGYTTIGSGANGQSSYNTVSTDTADETGSQTQTTTAGIATDTVASTWQWHEHDDETVTGASNATTGMTTSSDSASGMANDGSNYIGTYVRPVDGGTVNGTESGSASNATSYQDATNQSVDAYGVSTFSGTSGATAGGSSQDSYAGSGSYVVGTGMGGDGTTNSGGGTITESGCDNSNDSYSSNYTLGNDGSWNAASGSGSSNGNDAAYSSYVSSGG
jgi:hypothetical protein